MCGQRGNEAVCEDALRGGDGEGAGDELEDLNGVSYADGG